MLSKIDSLHKSCCDLEERLHELSEEKRRVETESVTQREALHKMQDREQDLSKDIETLRDENSHHSGTLSKLQVCIYVCRCQCVTCILVHTKKGGGFKALGMVLI